MIIDLDICFSDIPKDKLTTAKNGKLYGHIIVASLRDTDEYGNTHSVYMRQTKEEREAKDKKIYIGRAKELNFTKSEAPKQEPKPETPKTDTSNSDNEPLPF